MGLDVERVRRIGNMGRLAFSRYLDVLVDCRTAVRKAWPAERLEVLESKLQQLEAITLAHEAAADEAVGHSPV